MKNSKEYAEKIKKLHRSLKRQGKKVTPVTYDDPVEAIIYGILSEKGLAFTKQRTVEIPG